MNPRLWKPALAAVWVGSVVAAALIGGTVAMNRLTAPEVKQAEPPPTYYTVSEGTIGRSEQITIEASWPTIGHIYASRAGILTSIGSPVLTVGAELWRIDERSTIVFDGQVPAYRDLNVGTRGSDVEQLQHHLAGIGLFNGEVDGKFGSLTRRALQAWPRAAGSLRADQLLLGDVVSTTAINHPLRLTVNQGDPITPGQALADILDSTPRFTTTIDTSSADLLVDGQTAQMLLGDTTVDLVVTKQSFNQSGQRIAELAPVSPCDVCTSVPVDDTVLYEATVVRIPRVSGPAVPVSAIATLPGGAHTVTMSDGSERSIEIGAQDEGFAVVTGVDVGERVILPDWEQD